MLTALLACHHPDEPAPARDFPADFRFGTATAGFQVETGCPTWSAADCPIPPSDWAEFVTDPAFVGDAGLYLSGDPLTAGPGMWETFEDDAARMHADGMTALRLGLEWARLFPDGAAEAATTVDDLDAYADPAAVARYHEMFAALEDQGLEPVVTLNHYVLPAWVHDAKACHDDLPTCAADGWVTKDRIVPLIALYAGWCAKEYGGQVDTWFTLNEPFATTVSGYLLPTADRSAPPGLFLNIDAAQQVMLNQIEGHAAMVDAVRANDAADADGDGVAEQVGIVMNMVAIAPQGDDDALAVQHADYLYHALYLDAVTTGAWDDDLDGVPDRTRDDLAGRLDLLGINYYNKLTVNLTAAPFSQLPVFDFQFTYDNEPYTDGLREVVERGRDWGVPIWVTENGTPYVEDRGVEILDGHLSALKQAMDDGADVRGYLYWSYVDNYEWNHGMQMHFGLYGLDPVSKERIERPVAARYREIATSGNL
jgi:beta-glucosidase/6-phospho-beta-glucosidase/beta-galactosidase